MTPLHALITLVSEAEEGSRELDGLIAVTLRICPDKAPWAKSEFPNWISEDGRVYVVHSDGSKGAHWQAAHYTTSLDAELPGENIYRVQQYLKCFEAWHEQPSGEYTVARAKTEILARRLACLKAMADD